jgi:hypothetical protein
MSSAASTALIVLGLVGLIVGGVLLIVNSVKKRFKKHWKPGTTVAVVGLVMMLVGSLAGVPKSAPQTFVADLRVTSCSIEPEEIILGDIVTVTAEVENTGTEEGSCQLVMFVDGEETMTKD